MNFLKLIKDFFMSFFRKRKPTSPVTPSSVSPTVAVINESTVMSDAELTPIINALQIQCDRDFGPAWNVDCKLIQVFKGQTTPANAWQLVILDDSDQAGALGYHDFTAQGQPIAKVFAKSDLQYGAKVSVTISHECLEFLIDGNCDLSAQMDNTHFASYEVCDAVEADDLGYDINGVTVSDFVTSYYFMPQPPAGMKMDFRGVLSQPFSIAQGCYLNVWDQVNGWTQAANGEIKMSSRIEKH